VLIVDDHPLVRDGLEEALGQIAGVELVGSSATGAEALHTAQRVEPDIAIVDLHLPDMPGDELCERLRTQLASVDIIIFTSAVGEEIERRALAAGAARVVSKLIGLPGLRAAISEVEDGRAA
jgi:DNA-binding NarL/FixJ family response regulator